MLGFSAEHGRPAFAFSSVYALTWAGQRRGVNWSHVAEPRIGPRTKRQPPSASGGNIYLQRSQRTSACGAGR
jgi:hypothetical protein